uniref:N6-Methyl-AMP deaminase n=1 Tax=Naja naja TaxID=35670 RepID=A0A8C6VQL6_NAJNA
MAEAAATGRAPRFFQRLPKVELHAHLNGSISAATMKKLMAQKPHLQIAEGMVVIDKGTKRTLEECFQMFHFIHQMTSRPEDILMVTKDVVREFAADGVKYLELRSTPREEKSSGMTKRTYVEAVLEGIKQCQEEGLDIDVRFLVSVDRSKGAVVAKETVKLAGDFLLSTDGVVLGLDLSGNPKAGHGQDFLEPLLEAKKAGLKLTLHLSETDDKGVFATELSTEYQLVAETFQLSNEEIWALSSEAIDHVFAGGHTKTKLKERWRTLKPGLLKELC